MRNKLLIIFAITLAICCSKNEAFAEPMVLAVKGQVNEVLFSVNEVIQGAPSPEIVFLGGPETDVVAKFPISTEFEFELIIDPAQVKTSANGLDTVLFATPTAPITIGSETFEFDSFYLGIWQTPPFSPGPATTGISIIPNQHENNVILTLDITNFITIEGESNPDSPIYSGKSNASYLDDLVNEETPRGFFWLTDDTVSHNLLFSITSVSLTAVPEPSTALGITLLLCSVLAARKN